MAEPDRLESLEVGKQQRPVKTELLSHLIFKIRPYSKINNPVEWGSDIAPQSGFCRVGGEDAGKVPTLLAANAVRRPPSTT
ncbi:hypothetical protein [Pseudomonas sp. LFS044]|uniref:hypothetical protein n=1 Tax=Pseudomonas sp. LFS044 TaxID=3229880 RepID=UPI003A7F8B5F